MAQAKVNKTEVNAARSRLVMSALQVFSEKGFEGASTREICEMAEVNISAIRYYFGDKAGLYRAAFTEPMCDSPCRTNIETYANLPLPEALELFFGEFLDPLKRGEELRLVMKLHFREMSASTLMCIGLPSRSSAWRCITTLDRKWYLQSVPSY